MELDLDHITRQLRELATEAGAFLREQSRTFERGRVEEKRSHDYVSYVDKESERRIIGRLRQIVPQAGFVAEEGGGACHGDEEYCWLVDPLDGTTNFIHHSSPYCVSIALRSRTQLLCGVVYEVTRDECFWAHKESPAYLNGEEIAVSPIDRLDSSFVELGLPYDSERFSPFAVRLTERLYGRVAGLRVLGAAAVELCYIAAGRFEARIEGQLGPWDIAAGTLILRRAGGTVTDFDGGDNFYSGREVLATNGHIHPQLQAIVQQTARDAGLQSDNTTTDNKTNFKI